jgi:hypothetical protein
MMQVLNRKTGILAPLVLLVIATFSLALHIAIYWRTTASAFLNQPEFYYNSFVIRDIHGQWIRDVTLAAGFWSYVSAGIAVLCAIWATMLMRRHRREKGDGQQASE